MAATPASPSPARSTTALRFTLPAATRIRLAILDLAGRDSLHARGYRTEAGEAPLRESLAAGILAIADHRPDEPLYDPCCGSGTILVEAALRAGKMDELDLLVRAFQDRAVQAMQRALEA